MNSVTLFLNGRGKLLLDGPRLKIQQT